jgi:hypothetical protein
MSCFQSSRQTPYLLEESERISYIEELSLQHPEVEAVEYGVWECNDPPKGSGSDDDESVFLFGVPLPTNFMATNLMVAGWI